MKITRDIGSSRLWLYQKNYVIKVLGFNMTEVRPVITLLTGHFKLSFKQCSQSLEEENEISRILYISAVGSLMYVMVCTRSDLAYAVNTISRFMSNAGKQHWEAVKWVLRYLRGIARLRIVFQRLKMGKLRVLQGYVDADYRLCGRS